MNEYTGLYRSDSIKEIYMSVRLANICQNTMGWKTVGDFLDKVTQLFKVKNCGEKTYEEALEEHELVWRAMVDRESWISEVSTA